MDLDIKPVTNTNRQNNYDKWDRGLFLADKGVRKVTAKIVQATHLMYCNGGSTGIVSFYVRLYDSIITTRNQLINSPFQLVGPFTHATVNTVGDAISIEAYAIRAYKNNLLSPNQDFIAELIKQGDSIISKSSNGLVTHMETVTVLDVASSGLLEVLHSDITFNASNGNSTIRDTIRVVGTKNPLADVVSYIRSKAVTPV